LKDEGKQSERLNLVIDLPAKQALARLAICYGVTQKQMLMELLLAAERNTLQATALPGRRADYYAGCLRLVLEPTNSQERRSEGDDE
jgi:hypothetical protein